MAGRMWRIRCRDHNGRVSVLMVALHDGNVSIGLYGRVQFDEAGMVRLLTALGEAHYQQVNGHPWTGPDRPV